MGVVTTGVLTLDLSAWVPGSSNSSWLTFSLRWWVALGCRSPVLSVRLPYDSETLPKRRRAFQFQKMQVRTRHLPKRLRRLGNCLKGDPVIIVLSEAENARLKSRG